MRDPAQTDQIERAIHLVLEKGKIKWKEPGEAGMLHRAQATP